MSNKVDPWEAAAEIFRKQSEEAAVMREEREARERIKNGGETDSEKEWREAEERQAAEEDADWREDEDGGDPDEDEPWVDEEDEDDE